MKESLQNKLSEGNLKSEKKVNSQVKIPFPNANLDLFFAIFRNKVDMKFPFESNKCKSSLDFEVAEYEDEVGGEDLFSCFNSWTSSIFFSCNNFRCSRQFS